MKEDLYLGLLSSLAKEKWKRFGLNRRAGAVIPLFSIFSKKSIGIGEFTDLKLACDWIREVGMSIVQLLPLNDMGFNFRPYDCESSFALDPVYLNLEEIKGVRIENYFEEIKDLRRDFPILRRVNYGIKRKKLEILKKMFREIKDFPSEFYEYKKKNIFWLRDYSLFKVIKEEHSGKSWEEWETGFRDRKEEALEIFERGKKGEIEFQVWLQWQIYEQFKEMKEYAENKGVYLMGDLPFLVSRDSADVWAYRDYFKLGFSAGAPPDMYYTKGQRWGMPPYNWEEISKNNYDYIIERLKYAQNFYHMFRIDHVVGIFRIWTIPINEPFENFGLNGFFEPGDENLWEQQGRKILSLILENTEMLACAEDLGTVPKCSYKVLKELGIPGTEVLRWNKEWGKTYDFKKPEEFRPISISVLSTHDSSNFEAWWRFEAGTVEEGLFRRIVEERGMDFERISERIFNLGLSSHNRLRWKKIESIEELLGILELEEKDASQVIELYRGSFSEKEKLWNALGLKTEFFEENGSRLFFKSALEYVGKTASIFSINLLLDWLMFSDIFKDDCWERRINFPGIVSEKNWSYVMPISLEEMLNLEVNRDIREINKNSERI